MSRVDRDTLKSTFDEVAELYDRARPGYPPALFEDLFAETGRVENALEIGCGTGQASLDLAERCERLLCVEIGANLATIARHNLARFANAAVETASFEQWEASHTFDLVFAATCWHWLDPNIRYRKAVSLLRPTGHLAIVTNAHACPPGFDPFFGQIQETYRRIGASREPWSPPSPDEIPDMREEIETTGLFESVVAHRYLWTVDYTAEQYIDVLDTYSDHRTMEPSKREVLYDDIQQLLGSRVIRKHYQSILHVATIRP